MTDSSVPGDVIRLDGVTKTYQAGAAPALADVSLSVGWTGRPPGRSP